MQFDSLTFLVFFATVLVGTNVLRAWDARKNFLLAASYAFYMGWNPPFVLLLIASTTFDWWIARRIAATPAGGTRKAWIAATLVANLLVLGYFKYSDFILANLAALLGKVGVAYRPPELGIVLPIGISFYTFHSLSYCLDVYRGRFAPTTNWRDYALYVAFFPQLVAGPIVRWTQMREQIETPRGTTAAGLGLGLTLLTLGLFEKTVLADGVFAPVADAAFDHAGEVGVVTAWSGTVAFTGQIFCDFAGYSTCALGTAVAFGFVLPVNFRNPYAALGFSDFWRRWHVSLSSWLRDYLYVALGGNRGGAWRTYRNLMLTMLIGGLWHGAAWTFVAWGGLHGLYLAGERFIRERFWREREADATLRALYGLVTLLAVMFAWIWFRARSFADGAAIARALVPHGSSVTTMPDFAQGLALACFTALVLTHALGRDLEPKAWFARLPAPLLGLLLAAMLVLIALSPGDTHAFIYFQF